MEYKRTDDKEGGVQHPHVDGQLQVGNVKLETVKLNLHMYGPHGNVDKHIFRFCSKNVENL